MHLIMAKPCSKKEAGYLSELKSSRVMHDCAGERHYVKHVKFMISKYRRLYGKKDLQNRIDNLIYDNQ